MLEDAVLIQATNASRPAASFPSFSLSKTYLTHKLKILWLEVSIHFAVQVRATVSSLA